MQRQVLVWKVLEDGDEEDDSLASQAVKARQMEDGLEQQRKELVLGLHAWPSYLQVFSYESKIDLNVKVWLGTWVGQVWIQASNLQANSLRMEVPSLELQELQELAEEAARQDCRMMH